MTADDIRKLYWREPFAPFQLIMKDGRRFPVLEQGWMAISPTNDTMVVAPTILEFEIIDIPLIADHQFLDAATQTASGAA